MGQSNLFWRNFSGKRFSKRCSHDATPGTLSSGKFNDLSLRHFVTVMKQADMSRGLPKYMLGNREEIDGLKH